MATWKPKSQRALSSALRCHSARASASDWPSPWMQKSTIIVVPPASAAAVPVSQSSAVIVPPNGMSMWVWPSMKPGMSSLPATSTRSPPSGSVPPTWAIFPSRMAMSAWKEPSAVTTVPPVRSMALMPRSPPRRPWPGRPR
jgi:hypothetical protein